MRKLWKFALLGGTVGVAITVVKSGSSSSDQSEDVAGQAVRVGGSAMAAGAAVGLLLDRRSKKKAKRAGPIEAAREFATELIEEARPAVEQMARRARKRAEKAAGQAKDALAERTPIVVKVA